MGSPSMKAANAGGVDYKKHAIPEEPSDALVSKNPATTKHLI